ncbi:hypothetical protein HF324_28410 [Chitinophaga oryzae]|uniref:Uncharacterized protein n=1 Tax=Chitinophaga oryzae TaxID=2725414 RepID=A0ABX6LS03_9BACT|nr:hypothetical protein [Chitinophaga oryzae]QJB41559.1 hypothetical protein HF324_28410 [Chitinophaga oryzae]
MKTGAYGVNALQHFARKGLEPSVWTEDGRPYYMILSRKVTTGQKKSEKNQIAFGEYKTFPIFAAPSGGNGEVPEWPKGTVC